MWIFTQYGFYSAVCARQGDGDHANPVDESRIMVRARLRVHLELLLQRFDDYLGDAEITETPHTDYRYRVFVDKSVWTRVLSALADELDYDNFKSRVAANLEVVGSTYEHSLHDVWGVMHGLQE